MKFHANKKVDRMMRLKRRANWLQARVAIGEDRKQDMNLDKAELGAMRWAIEELEKIHGPTPEPDETPKLKPMT